MDSEPKYSVGEVFEIDDNFLESLEDINEACVEDILNQLHDLSRDVDNNFNVQWFAGVTHSCGQLFFEVSVLKEEKKYPFYIEIKEISSDEYLDYRLLDKTI